MSKTILLAVCGSVSFYKSYEILSRLKKLNLKVKVALSPGFFKFGTALGFEALSDFEVLHEGSESWSKGITHIECGKVDLILIAPASVNTINKLAYGICDNVFMQTLIASKAPILLAPAANHNMLQNPATKTALEILQNRGVQIIEPVAKILACKDFGKGGLAEVDEIIYKTQRELLKDSFFHKKRVIITGGATTENIDSVRGVTNFSSGKMAKALADEFYFAGSEVKFISSVDFVAPYDIIKFKTSNELLSAINSQISTSEDILIMCAAVSDFVPKTEQKGKLKKENLGEIWSLELKQNLDILKSISKPCKKIGFKLEFDKENAKKNALNMLQNKNIDAVCLNIFDENLSFGSEFNEIVFLKKDYELELGLKSKNELSKEIVNLVKTL